MSSLKRRILATVGLVTALMSAACEDEPIGPGGTPTNGQPSTGAASANPVPSSGCGSTNAPRNNTYTINVEGTERSYILNVPANYDPRRPYRLILAYHPLGGTAQFVARGNYYGLLPLSNGSTIFAAPQGIGNGWWDSGRSLTSGGQDIKFARALVERLTSQLCIDESRIFAEGFSMGGSMSYAIGCAMGDVVRGVVAHSGGPMSGCVLHNTPVAYFMTHGTSDPVCSYPGFAMPPLEDFGRVNGCTSKPMQTPPARGPACVDFEGCRPGYPARGCLFSGGHTPSPPGNWVPRETWDFISQF